MRVIIALAASAMLLSLDGCARSKQAAYSKPALSAPGSNATKANALEPAQKPAKRLQAPMPPSPHPARDVTSVVEGTQGEAKLKAAQAKAAKVGIENLTKEDIDDLTSSQLKQLRGY